MPVEDDSAFSNPCILTSRIAAVTVSKHSIKINSHFIKFLILSLIILINGPKSLVTLKEKKSHIHIATIHTEYNDGNLAPTSSPQSI